jgi:hypothetical protein
MTMEGYYALIVSFARRSLPAKSPSIYFDFVARHDVVSPIDNWYLSLS